MFKVVIFDMNGVIIVDEQYHDQSWQEFCKKYGFNLTEDEFRTEVMGRRDQETLDFLFKKKLNTEEINKYADERDRIIQEIEGDKLALPDGLLDLLKVIRHNNILLAIATSSRRGYMNFIIDKFDLRKFFPIIVTAEDVINGKPDPEIYIKTASLLKINPSECLVIEDSRSGITAAKSAGMKVVGITSSLSREELGAIADYVIDSFNDFDLNLLR